MEEKINPFLVLEGVDGAGKTTIAKQLALGTQGVYMKTPGEGYKDSRAYIDNGTAPEAKLLFYLSSVCDASFRIKKSLQDKSVFCDRYEWSSLIPHAAYFNKELDDLERVWNPISSGLIRPNHTILLVVEEEEQLARIRQNRDLSNLSASDKFCMNQELRRKVRGLYEQVAQRENWLRVDTTGRKAEEVTAEILEKCGVLV